MYVLSMYITGSLSLLAFELFYFHYMFNTRQTEVYTECCSYCLLAQIGTVYAVQCYKIESIQGFSLQQIVLCWHSIVKFG